MAFFFFYKSDITGIYMFVNGYVCLHKNIYKCVKVQDVRALRQ